VDGLLLVDKPSGWTSFDVVARVRSILRQVKSEKLKAEGKKQLSTLDFQLSTPSPKVKVGHTGTLDPLATGLLVLVIGSYTKRAGEFSKLDKTYEVTMKLGQTSTTGDEEGDKTPVSDIKPSKDAILAAIKRFEGDIMQTPHKFSAIKINGQRAYKLARSGQEVQLEPRKVTIFSMTDVNYSYPEIKFTAEVSSGTYIRSLVEDIGSKLGTGAYMTALRRTRVGTFVLHDALVMDRITAEKLEKARRY